jgi:hypothetical protein
MPLSCCAISDPAKEEGTKALIGIAAGDGGLIDVGCWLCKLSGAPKVRIAPLRCSDGGYRGRFIVDDVYLTTVD